MEIFTLKQKVQNEECLTKYEILSLVQVPLDELCSAANEIREYFCGNTFDICTIINSKSGKCSENCKFCAQSSFYSTHAKSYPFMNQDSIMKQAYIADTAGVMRFSLVNSGKKASQEEIGHISDVLETLSVETSMKLCVSLGLLSSKDYLRLKKSGLSRVHNNLESSRNFFPHICTTHTFDEKIESIKNAQACGLEVCSGGIFGLGETMEDRIDMALTLRELGIQSVPINILFPIQGTPFEKNIALSMDEIKRIVAIYRFILPKAFLRLAGGRKLLENNGESLFSIGANALISGDMLTITGSCIEDDILMLKKLGFVN